MAAGSSVRLGHKTLRTFMKRSSFLSLVAVSVVELTAEREWKVKEKMMQRLSRSQIWIETQDIKTQP